MGNDDTSPSAPAHAPGTGKGEEIKERDGGETGRHDKSASHANRPAGGRTSRDSTAINPDDVNSETGQEMPPP
jgi:hypothetical protein